ncbi:unnamed protein product [Blumeria hordei]|uniref:Uncharacterized protein n=1 Tax=Blumeria hordei TaxID=2867405 RepID=A0A383UYQ1_BLUHO|nr:unnamed protein product [Blumeria hordei]
MALPTSLTPACLQRKSRKVKPLNKSTVRSSISTLLVILVAAESFLPVSLASWAPKRWSVEKASIGHPSILIQSATPHSIQLLVMELGSQIILSLQSILVQLECNNDRCACWLAQHLSQGLLHPASTSA